LAVAAFAFSSVLCAVPAAAGQAQNPPPAPAQAPAPGDQLTFSVDRLLVFFQVAVDSAVDFEVTMGKVKEVLAKSDKPERRKQAEHWKLMKSASPQDGMVTFFFLLDEVVKGVSYDPFKILGEGLPPAEVKALFDKLAPGLKGISAAPLGPIISMGGGGH
jgi:hypothetical protein